MGYGLRDIEYSICGTISVVLAAMEDELLEIEEECGPIEEVALVREGIQEIKGQAKLLRSWLENVAALMGV